MEAALIFAGTYVVLAFGRLPFFRVDRTGAAIVGAILMVVLGVIPLDDAYRAIDFRTLILLFGMMVLIASLRLARFFRTVARAIVVRVRHPAVLLVTVVFTTGVLSALFVNDTICLVFTPILIEVAESRGQRAVPYLLALATASNIGSVATITGNPQNMLIASLSRIGYSEFALALAPMFADVIFTARALDGAGRKLLDEESRPLLDARARATLKGYTRNFVFTANELSSEYTRRAWSRSKTLWPSMPYASASFAKSGLESAR